MRQNKIVKIIVYPRIHVTLIGMNNQGYRLNGGIGFSIENPSTKVSFNINDIFEIIDERINGFSNQEIKNLVNKLDTIYLRRCLSNKMVCRINSEAPSHCGFGTSTSIRLACVEALMILNQEEYDNETIINLSGRGGTSGIGINTYFQGGMVFDIGTKDRSATELLPSSARENRLNLPLTLVKETLPDWSIGLLIPNNIIPKTQIEEVNFFKKNALLHKEQVDEILYEVVYGVVPSIIEYDISSFCTSINKIQNTAWKKAEREQYGLDLFKLENMLRNLGAHCVGMSSLGPGLFFIADDYIPIQQYIESNKVSCTLLVSRFNNNGRLVDYD